MKTNLIRKFKWYIVGFILVVIMLSVGLSFCSWDNLSVQALNAKAKTGNYGIYVLAKDIYKDDSFNEGQNGIANVGDIVTFGRYYQTANNISTKTPLRWIVVDTTVGTDGKTTLTLLAENIIAFGSFWGTWCYTSSNSTWQGAWGNTTAAYQTYYQNYEQSTVRAWLNSNYTLRNDGGTVFAENESGVYKGFFKEAFNAEEQAYIQEKTISGMSGSKKAAGSNTVNSTYCEDYNDSIDKVWLPSYSEIYGNDTIDWDGKSDGLSNSRFSYFSGKDETINNTRRVGKTTAFASSSTSNYTYKGKTAASDNWQNVSASNPAWWWLRSPLPLRWTYALIVDAEGISGNVSTDLSHGGVRPAVCIKL